MTEPKIECVGIANVAYTSIEVAKLDKLIEQRNALLEALKALVYEWHAHTGYHYEIATKAIALVESEEE
jgi:hypothetical protein